jgi:restriction system protein
MSLHSRFKGWLGESMGAVAQWLYLDRDTYFPLNNVTISTMGGTTQIDHVIASRYGLFVVESKNIDGWVFGDEKSAQWSIVKPGRKFRIQNPLRQNYRHTKALVDFLEIDRAHVHSVVMFWGKCEFKTPMPRNVIREGYASYIKSFQSVCFSDETVQTLVARLESGMLPKARSTHREHIASLQARHSSTTTCPTCGNGLVVRTARSGPNAGEQFYGCSAYPRCRYTKPLAAD